MKHNSWLLLLLILLLCSPPLFVHIGLPAPVRIMEDLSFLTSQETWLHMHAQNPDAWKVPSWNGKPRVQKPPLLVWMNMLAWMDLDPQEATIEQLVLRSRIMAALIALISVAAVYWAGLSLGGVRLASLAALAAGSGIFFIRQARYATYDTHIMGWATLAVAAGLWAARADQQQSLRRVIGWLFCTLALTATNYTKGPLGFALVLPPLAIAVGVFPESRRRNGWALALVAGLSLLALAPWLLILHRHVPEASGLLDTEYRYIFGMFRNPLFYLIIIGVVFPWTFWLIGGFALPFTDRRLRADRGLLFAWGWLAVILILLSLSPVKNKRYIVPALPPAGLLTAYAVLTIEKMIREGKELKWLRALRSIHWGVLGGGSFLLPGFIAAQPLLIRAGILKKPELYGISTVACVAIMIILVALWRSGFRANREARISRAALITTLWMTVAATCGYHGYALAPSQQFAQRVEVESFALFVRDTPIYYISRFKHPYHEAMPTKDFLIYYRGVVPAISQTEIAERVAAGEAFLLMTRLTPEDESALELMGFRYLFELDDSRKPDWKIWAHGNVGH